MNISTYIDYAKWMVRTAISHPVLLIRDLNRLFHRRLLLRSHAPGIDIFGEDWDNLVILDACRYDMFAEMNTITGELSEKRSRGSHTVEFLYANFKDRDLRDTVYVTANPQLYRHRSELGVKLHATVNVWEEDTWDEDAGTVMPKSMTDRALEIATEYPEKRLIIHYVQPHYPFVTDESDFDKGVLREGSMTDFWTEILIGELDVSKDRIWELYRENLALALPQVQRLVDQLNGKTVVTSDHGNMVGERASPIPIREWGHPIGLYTDELVSVPWLECPTKSRRKVVVGEAEDEGVIEEAVSDRLSNLGYIE